MNQKKRQNEILPFYVKICFGMSSISKAAQGLVASTFLLFFYTEALNIPSNMAANVIFLGKVLDVLDDPLTGILLDRTRSKEGKCRFWLKCFSIPAGLMITLSFWVPDMSPVGTILWVGITYALQATASSLMQIPANTLMGRLTTNKQQQAHLNQISGLFSLTTNFALASITLPLARALGNGDLRHGFAVLGVIYGVLYATPFLVVWAGTKGYEPIDTAEESFTEPISTRDSISALLSNEIWLCVIGMYLLDMVSTTLESSSMVYYFTYNIGNTDLLSLYSAVAGIANAVIFLTLHKFTARLGNSGTAMGGCILTIAAHLFRFLFHDSSVSVMVLGWFFSNAGACMIAGTILPNLFDAKTYGEWKTGVAGEAVAMSGFTLSTKIGMALGTSGVGWLLALVPYVEGAAHQVSDVTNMLFYMGTLMPAGLFALALLLCIPIFKREKEIVQMREEINARKT